MLKYNIGKLKLGAHNMFSSHDSPFIWKWDDKSINSHANNSLE